MPRASDVRKTERLNQARTLLHARAPRSEAAERLARDWSVSKRQAYRYLQRAQQLQEPVPVEDAKVSFTVKLSRRLVGRLRTYAASTGLTLSEIVSRAVQAVLHGGEGLPRKRTRPAPDGSIKVSRCPASWSSEPGEVSASGAPQSNSPKLRNS